MQTTFIHLHTPNLVWVFRVSDDLAQYFFYATFKDKRKHLSK